MYVEHKKVRFHFRFKFDSNKMFFDFIFWITLICFLHSPEFCSRFFHLKYANASKKILRENFFFLWSDTVADGIDDVSFARKNFDYIKMIV